MIRRPPRSTRSPCTTLFRSRHADLDGAAAARLPYGRARVGGGARVVRPDGRLPQGGDRKSTRLNSSHATISYAVFCLNKHNQRDYLGCCVVLETKTRSQTTA